jgi:hypothetical protein
MKRRILLLMLFAIGTISAKSQSFSDNFDSYTAGIKLGPQSPNWTTWSNADGGTEDVNVVTTAAHSGLNSIYFSSTSTTGGPADVVLPFAGPHTQGIFEFKAWFKVPTNKTAYFNFQAENTIGTTWAMDCYMNADGSLQINNASVTYITASYPQNQWYQLKVKANLSTNQWEVFVDSVSVGTFSNITNKIASIDIYPANASASFWVDDVSYSLTPFTLPQINAAVGTINIPNGLVGQVRKPKVSFRNLGDSAITSFDFSLTHKGTAITKSLTGLNIAKLAEYKLNLTEDFILPANNDTATLTISNINGLANDNDSTDNKKTIIIRTVIPADGKIVLAEEGTGTWCQWCPRGAVFMDMMSKNYEGYFAGVAVHNADPMTVIEYDAAVSAAIPGYPSVLTDRSSVIDPSDLEVSFIDQIVKAPDATLKNGATYDAVTRELKVSITTTLNKDIAGDYRIACVLSQDSVRGTGSAYNQANAYAGGANGAMGGFELLTNPVAASKMTYDHVARHISPSFDGYPNAFGVSTDSGQSVTYTFSYILPATWNASKMNIVGMMLDPNGATVNASTSRINTAVTNGYIIGTEIGGNLTGINKLAGPDAIHIAPNPGTEVSNIMLSLVKEANIQVEIYNMNGAKVGSKNYGMLNGEMSLPIQLSELSSGLYLVKIMVDSYPTTLKLIKN